MAFCYLHWVLGVAVVYCGWKWRWEGLVVTGEVIFKKSKIVLGDMASVFSVAAYVLLRVCYLFWDESCVGILVWKL